MPPELRHLSHSSIQSWLLCGHAWRLHYVDKIKTPTAPAQLFGQVVHKVIESYLRMRCGGIAIPDLVLTWKNTWKESATGDTKWGDEKPETYAYRGDQLFGDSQVHSLLAKIDPLVRDGQPVLEHRIELQVPGVPVPIIGYADLVTSDLVPADFKTAARLWPAKKAVAEVQPLIYLAALNQMGWKLPSLKFRHIIFVSGKTLQVQVLETTYSPRQIFGAVEIIQNVWRGIQAESFTYNTGSWKHDPKWCEYWDICSMGGKR